MEKMSPHETRVYDYVAKSGKWVTSTDIARATEVAPRTARALAFKLVDLGIFLEQQLYPAHRYRLSPHAHKRNPAYIKRLENAKEAFAE